MRLGWVALVASVLLTGCSGGPATDPAALAVSESHSAVAGLALAVRLRLENRSTDAYTQVLLDTTRDAVADAQRELVVAADADPARRAPVAALVTRAASELSVLAQAGAAELDADDLSRLEALERQLRDLATQLGR